MNMSTSVTSVVDVAPEVSAPIRLEGQTNTEVLFDWMAVKGHLWMLNDEHIDRFSTAVGFSAAFKILKRTIAWTDGAFEEHPALKAPAEEAEIKNAFSTLDRLLKIHFFGNEATNGNTKSG